MPRSVLVAVALAIASAPGTARADDALPALNPDGTARDPAADVGPIDGFAVAVGLNSSTTFGLGADGLRGGGGLSLRVGTEASPTMLWLLQIESIGYLVENIDPMTNESSTDINAQTLLTLGVQKYVSRVMWARGGGGFATFTRRQTMADEPKEQVGGLGVVMGGGIDVLRSGIFALALELIVTVGRYDGGSIGTAGLSFTAAWY